MRRYKVSLSLYATGDQERVTWQSDWITAKDELSAAFEAGRLIQKAGLTTGTHSDLCWWLGGIVITDMGEAPVVAFG